MRALSTIAMLVVVAAASALGTTGRALAAPDARLTIGSLTLDVDEEGSVVFRATEIADPGISAWTVDVTYDLNIVSVTDCAAANEYSVCYPDYASDTVRISGASATYVTEELTLAQLTVHCQAGGASALAIQVIVWSNVVVEPAPAPDLQIEEGTITCVVPGADATPTATGTPPAAAASAPPLAVAALPSTGQAGGESSAPALAIGALIAVGAAVVGTAVALRARG